MLISIDKRLAFLAMPKTGTTSLQKALQQHCEIRFGRSPRTKHMSMRVFEEFMLPYLRQIGAGDTETFCVIREPVDWLGSWYRYRRRLKLNKARRSTKAMSFETFVEGYLANPQPEYARVGRPTRFVAGMSGEPAVTHMFRYENIPGMVAFLEKRFGKTIRLPKVNVSPTGGEMTLSPALRARLETERAEDFALYADHAR